MGWVHGAHLHHSGRIFPRMSLMPPTNHPTPGWASRELLLPGNLVAPRACPPLSPKEEHFPGHKSLCLAQSQPWSCVTPGTFPHLSLASPTINSWPPQVSPQSQGSPTGALPRGQFHSHVTKHLSQEQEELWDMGHQVLAVPRRCFGVTLV